MSTGWLGAPAPQAVARRARSGLSLVRIAGRIASVVEKSSVLMTMAI
jgi:hypothetical protein